MILWLSAYIAGALQNAEFLFARICCPLTFRKRFIWRSLLASALGRSETFWGVRGGGGGARRAGGGAERPAPGLAWSPITQMGRQGNAATRPVLCYLPSPSTNKTQTPAPAWGPWDVQAGTPHPSLSCLISQQSLM